MVTKGKGSDVKKKGKVKVLNLNKETVKNLTVKDFKKVKGGLGVANQTATCKCLRLTSLVDPVDPIT